MKIASRVSFILIIFVVVDILEGGICLSQINLAEGVKLATTRSACSGNYRAGPGTNLHDQRAENITNQWKTKAKGKKVADNG